jgi:hypothetical protein
LPVNPPRDHPIGPHKENSLLRRHERPRNEQFVNRAPPPTRSEKRQGGSLNNSNRGLAFVLTLKGASSCSYVKGGSPPSETKGKHSQTVPAAAEGQFYALQDHVVICASPERPPPGARLVNELRDADCTIPGGGFRYGLRWPAWARGPRYDGNEFARKSAPRGSVQRRAENRLR